MSYTENLADETKKSVYLFEIEPIFQVNKTKIFDTNKLFFPYGEPVAIDFKATTNQAFQISNSPDDFVFRSPEPGVGDEVSFTFDAATKIITFSAVPAFTTYIRYKQYFATDTCRTYRDPLDDQTEIIEWENSIEQAPTITRDISENVTGFYPASISNIQIAAPSEDVDFVYATNYKNAEFKLYHFVGPLNDVTNGKQISNGIVQNHSYDIDLLNLDLADRFIQFQDRVKLPITAQTYKAINDTVTYSVSDTEQGFTPRRIYGVVNGVEAVNVDYNETTPTKSNNRKWAFGYYDGDNTKIQDKVWTNTPGLATRFFSYEAAGGALSHDYVFLHYRLPVNETAQDVLDVLNDLEGSAEQQVIFENSDYPGVFASIQVSGFHFFTNNQLSGTPASGKGNFALGIRLNGIINAIASNWGTSEANAILSLENINTTTTVTIPTISQCVIYDTLENDLLLNDRIHYTIFRDPVNKIYGIELLDDIENIIYSDPANKLIPFTGNEIIAGRVYGPKATETVGNDSYVRLLGQTPDFQNLGVKNISNFPAIFYDYAKNFLNLSDNQIDLDTLNFYANNYIPIIDTINEEFTQNAGEFTQTLNFTLPRSKGDFLDNLQETLNKIASMQGVFIFFNNDGKLTYRNIGYLNNDTIIDLDDSDFEFANAESYNTIDTYGLSRLNDNFVERSRFSEDGRTSNTYFFDEIGYIGHKDGRYYEIESLFQDPRNTAFLQSEFSYAQNEEPSFGYYFQDTFRFLTTRQQIVTINVPRRYFNIDIGDVVRITSDVLSSDRAIKYLVVGITQNFDTRTIKLIDIIQRAEDEFREWETLPIIGSPLGYDF